MSASYRCDNSRRINMLVQVSTAVSLYFSVASASFCTTHERHPIAHREEGCIYMMFSLTPC